MICYFIKGTDVKKGDSYRRYEAMNLTDKERGQIAKIAAKLAAEIGAGKNITFYSQDVVPAIETMMITLREFSALSESDDSKKQFSEIDQNNVFVDQRLNPPRLDLFFKDKKRYFPDKDKEYVDRVFNFMTEMIMSHNEEDIAVIFGDNDLFEACQYNKDLHNLIYFGDEYIRELDMFDFFRAERGYNAAMPDGIQNWGLISMDNTLISKKVPTKLVPEQLIIEKPEYKRGCLVPVYEKYAKLKLNKKDETESQQQPGAGE